MPVQDSEGENAMIHYLKMSSGETALPGRNIGRSQLVNACDGLKFGQDFASASIVEGATKEAFARLVMTDGTGRVCPDCYKINLQDLKAG
jgi:hypothetical protein